MSVIRAKKSPPNDATVRVVRPVRTAAAVAIVLAATLARPTPVHAAVATIGLGTAASFAVLAGAGITNTGPSTVNGDIGTFPTPSETGLGTLTLNGTDHAADAVTQQAKNDLTTAYNQAAGSGPATAVATELGGTTLTPGVYNSPTLAITGTLTLDTLGDPSAVFVFQTSSTLITATASSVIVLNGGTACNVFWQVGSSATLGTGSTLIGSLLTTTSITANTGATIQGRLLASNGAVTLDTNTISRPACPPPPTPTTTTIAGTTTIGVATPIILVAVPDTTSPQTPSSAPATTAATAATESSNRGSGISISGTTPATASTPAAPGGASPGATPTSAAETATAVGQTTTNPTAPATSIPLLATPAPAVPSKGDTPPTRLAFTGSNPRGALTGLLLLAGGAILLLQTNRSRDRASIRRVKVPTHRTTSRRR